jgi:hypothetical protein
MIDFKDDQTIFFSKLFLLKLSSSSVSKYDIDDNIINLLSSLVLNEFFQLARLRRLA